MFAQDSNVFPLGIITKNNFNMAYEITEAIANNIGDLMKSGRVFTSHETASGNFSDQQLKHMFELNNNPEIDSKNKYWELVTVCKTNTLVTRWVIKINNKLFSVIQGKIYKVGPACVIYETEDKKKGTCDYNKPYRQYNGVIDMEYCCDIFAHEYIAQRILDGRFANVITQHNVAEEIIE